VSDRTEADRPHDLMTEPASGEIAALDVTEARRARPGTGGDGLPLVRRPVYEVRLEAFEGPLDLLLHLIREHEIDIYDIPIATITEQYLEYIEIMESLDLSLAGEFLEMAATLIRIKVQMLLPPSIEESEDEEDPRQQLVRKLVEYKQFKEAAEVLSTHEEERKGFFPHGVDTRQYRVVDEDEVDTEEFLRDVTLFDLVDCLREVLARVPHRIDVHEVDREIVSVEDRMEHIRTAVARGASTTFRSLFADAVTRVEIVTTFIALLELIRLGAILAVQDSRFGEIAIQARTEV
jgi:segregation and condensation protein A